MTPDECIAALDDALAEDGEDVILRRIVGAANIDVTCRAKVIPLSLRFGVDKIVGGVVALGVSIVISPTQIDRAQWPGGTLPLRAPFNTDPRIPRIDQDRAIVRGRLYSLTYVTPLIVAGKIVRIEMWTA